MKRSMSYSAAFTLIELLVVISIIALLISILLPALTMARESGRGIQCLSNQRQLGIVMSMYADASQDYFVNVSMSAASYPDAGGTGTIYWPYKLIKQGFITNLPMLTCPTFNPNRPTVGGAVIDWAAVDKNTSTWNATLNTNTAFIHYGYNQRFVGSTSGILGGSSAKSAHLTQIMKPSETILALDSARTNEFASGIVRGYLNAYDYIGPGGAFSVGHGRHAKDSVVNTVWVDGHGSAVRVDNPIDVYPQLPGRDQATEPSVWDHK